MGFNRDRATFAEIDHDAAQAEAEAMTQQQAEASWTADEKKVLAEVRKHPGKSGNMLRELTGMRRNRISAILEELQKKSKLEYTKGGWYPTSGVSRDDDE
jgi:DNA-binding MarR family transcriptional regulator